MNMKKNGKPYFPMFVDLTGAGTIAKRRIRSMIEFTDHLYVIAPEVNKELKEMEEAGKLTILRKTYEREDLYDASLVIAATNDHKINQDIYAACKCLGIPVNVCQDREHCDFYFPGLAMQDNLVVGVSTSGQEKKRQKGIAGRLQQFLDEDQAGILQKKEAEGKE